MTPPVTPTAAPTAGPSDDLAARPLEAARALLHAALTTRHATEPTGPLPQVVPLGSDDALGAADTGEVDPRSGRHSGARPTADPHAERRPAATVHLAARAVLIGPWGGAEAGAACGRCLAMRWQRLRSRSEREALELGGRPAGGTAWPLLTDYALDAVWAAYRAAFTTARPAADAQPADRTLPQVTRVDLVTLATATFPLLPEPLCPHCVRPTPETADQARLPLSASPKPDPDGYRLRPLDAFPLPTAALANPVCGALGADTWLNPTSTTTAPVAGSHFVRGYAGLNDVTWSGQANRYRTSRTLAFLEGLERYAGTHRRRGTAPVTEAYHGLLAAGTPALDPTACGAYAPETYREDPMVSPFDPERPIPWVWGHSLRDDQPILVPRRLVHYSAGLAADNFVFECSNGCATGSRPEEAILHALLELVERDAFLIAWHARIHLTEIDLTGAHVPPSVAGMLERATLHGYQVHAFDTRMDLPVPVITGLAARRDGGAGTLSFSAAAGFDPQQTLESALSEVLTYLPHLPYQVAERRAELEAMADDYHRVKQLKDHAQLYGLPRMARHAREYREPAAVAPLERVYRDWQAARPRTGDLLDDLRLLVDALVRAGHDVIAVDQTTPEQRRMGLHTVRAVVPGLLPLDFGWGRQRVLRMPRLRTAPRAAGRRSDTLPQDAIKVVPHPFP